jgi:C1A family cysteine protease
MARQVFGINREELRLLEQEREWIGAERSPMDLEILTDAYPPELSPSLADKRLATAQEVLAYFLEDDKPYIETEGQAFRLLREDETDNLSPEEIDLAAQHRLLWNEQSHRPLCETTPAAEDHRGVQTQVRNQLDRGTCVCFASLAGLESLHRRQGTTLDLSEQYANWLFMGFEGRDQCDDGMKTTDAAAYLAQKGVCTEDLSRYENDATVRQHCADVPPPDVQQQARYGVGSYVIIDRLGLMGPSIANTDYLECLLSHGHDIVFGVHVAWGQPDAHGVLDVIRDPYGNPLRSRGGHAMLLVGYNRRPDTPIPYFIFKNSWGATGVGGYYYLSYDYVRYYSKYGFVVLSARADMNE